MKEGVVKPGKRIPNLPPELIEQEKMLQEEDRRRMMIFPYIFGAFAIAAVIIGVIIMCLFFKRV